MIDHLIKFTDEATAIADPVVGAYYMPPRAATANQPAFPGAWRSDCTFKTQVYTLPGTFTTFTKPDGSTVQIPDRAYLPYFYIWIALPAQDDAIAAMPNCMAIADRNTMTMLQCAIPPVAMSQYHVEPVIAGSNYPFGQA